MKIAMQKWYKHFNMNCLYFFGLEIFTFLCFSCIIIMVNIMERDNKVIKIIYYILGVFIISLIYNAVFVPNNIVLGGVSGLAIIVRQITGMSTTVFIDVANVVLIIISFIFLSKKEASRQLVGCIIYPLMITLTEPIAKLIHIELPQILLLLLVASVIYGAGAGVVYRAGYSTGGFDIITQILSNKLKKSITQISPILNFTVIIVGGFIFSPVQVMYAIIIIYISNKVTNGVLFSVSTSKMVYVISAKSRDIENYIMKECNLGATELKVHSGLFEKNKQMIMCVVHNTQYRKFKEKILTMDPNAFMLSKYCFQVSGGLRYELLPF